MLQLARSRLFTAARAFSTTAIRQHDMAKVTLIGRLGADPEFKTTKTDKEYVQYVVATRNYPPPPANEDGSRPEGTTSWHRILSFGANANNYLRTLSKGSSVYVEANLEIRDGKPGAEPGSPESQRQWFLRHENIRLLKGAPNKSSEGEDS